MRSRAPVAMTVLLSLALLATLLAGCTSPPPEEPVAPAGEAETGTAEAGLVSAEEAANVTSNEEQQSEFAKALEEKFHTHDYWSGALEKTLMDGDVDSAPLVPESEAGPLGTAFSVVFGLSPFGNGYGLTPFELPEGSIVPPEAERLEVTITWIESHTITGLRLAYLTAGQGNTQRLDPLPPGGGTYTIPTNVTQNDIPHTSVSKWRFWLVPESDTPTPAVFNGTAHVLIKAFRNDTLYVAPPHPDHWGDNTTMPIYNGTGFLRGTRAVIPVFTMDGNGGFAWLELPENTTIAPHTALLTVELTWANRASTPDPFGIHPVLRYRSADTRAQREPEVAVSEPGRTVYTITVDPRMTDSPYANRSEWFFVLQLDSDAPTDQGSNSFLGDVGDFDGEYAVTIVAEREAIPV